MNIERKLNTTGEIANARDVYNYLLDFETCFHVATNNWNKIYADRINKMTEDDVIEGFEGMKAHKNPLKLSDKKEFKADKMLKDCCSYLKDEFFSTRPPFGGSYEEAVKEKQGALNWKKVVVRASKLRGVYSPEDLAWTIINCWRYVSNDIGKFPTDSEWVPVFVSRAQDFVPTRNIQ